MKKYLSSKQKGSVLEFVLVFPIVLFLTLGAIEFGRYFILRGIAEAGAQKVLSFASVVADLENESLDGHRTRSEITMEQVLQRASMQMASWTSNTDAVSGGFIQNIDQPDYLVSRYEGDCPQRPCIKILEFMIPKGDDADSLSKALSEKPMRIKMQTEYSPILPFLNKINLNVESIAYREPRFSATLPLRKDCHGVIGGDGEGCVCPDNPKKIIRDGVCVCRPGLYNNADESDCICAADNREWDATLNRCECKACPDQTFVQNQNTCACSCPNNFQNIEGSCTCPAPFILNQYGQCVCDQSKLCPSGATLNISDCQCKCSSGRTLCNDQCVTNCRVNAELDSDCNCKCKQGYEQCNNGSCIKCDGGSFDPTDCSCKCPAGKRRCVNGCIDCPCDANLNFSTCTCGASNPYLTPQIDQMLCSDGSCDRSGCHYSGMELDKDSPNCGKNNWTACTCPQNEPVICHGYDENTYYDKYCWSECTISGQARGVHHLYDCGCRCPEGQSPVDGECKDTDCSNTGIAGQIPDTTASGCVCPEHKPEICDNECMAFCPWARTETSWVRKNRTDTNCDCSCPAGRVPLSRTSGTLVMHYCLNQCSGGMVHVPVGTGYSQGFKCECPADKPIYCNGNCVENTCAAQGKIHDSNTCDCICPPDKTMQCDGQCYQECPTGFVRKPGNCSECVCPDNMNICPSSPGGPECKPACSGQQSHFDPGSCTCRCASGMVECGTAGNLVCAEECTGGKIRDQSNCSQCICPTNLPRECDNSCYANCPAGTEPAGSGNCSECNCLPEHERCANGQCKQCPQGFELNTSSCQCVCPSNTTECGLANGLTCMSDSDWSCTGEQEKDPSECGKCKCPSSKPNLCEGQCYANCKAGNTWNSGECSCDCLAGYERCNSGACKKCTGNKELNKISCSCVCTNVCDNGASPDPNNNCSCTLCPGEKILCNGQCVDRCADTYILDSNCNCTCPNNFEEVTCGIPQQQKCMSTCSLDPLKTRNSATCDCECEPKLTPQQCGRGEIAQNPDSCNCECINGAQRNSDYPNEYVCLSPPDQDCYGNDGVLICETSDDGTRYGRSE